MPLYNPNILEEELKNKVAADWFGDYDTTQIVGRIDFAVAYKQPETPQLPATETQFLLWAEAKRGTKRDIKASLVQLVLTIGQARTFDDHLPPMLLGAFDAEKIAFLPYNTMLDTFCATDFDWTVTPSNHETREFRQLYAAIDKILQQKTYTFNFEAEGKELRRFIRQNFRAGQGDVSRIRINKNNFTAIYRKWRDAVMPTIDVNWDLSKRNGILDGHFFLADILSTNDNAPLSQKLFVVLANDHYELDKKRDDEGFFNSKRANFTDGGKAHGDFWRKYQRPPRLEYQKFIKDRIDLLVPQDVREYHGEYFTPQQWVELSQQYIADELGENWQEEYFVWDCCAGTGNLLAGLIYKHRIWASTLRQSDVDIMHDRIDNGANLLHKHVFQFDFLNDEFGGTKDFPADLLNVLNDPEKRRRLIIYINPPYAEASDTKTLHGGKAKNAVEQSATNKKYKNILGQGNAELFAQFFIRVYHEIPTCVLAEFSTLKILQGPHFANFRHSFRAKLGRLFCVPANTFDNVKGEFPIGFFVWNTGANEEFQSVVADFYDKNGDFLQHKTICAYRNEHFMNEWIKPYRAAKGDKDVIGKFPFKGNDFQNQRMVQIVQPTMSYNDEAGQFYISKQNVGIAAVYFAVRKCIEPTWLNDRDQFLFPNDGWKADCVFQTDCLVYTLFNNNIQSRYGANYWIPFTEQEVDAQEMFQSHFMSDYIGGATPRRPQRQGDLFDGTGAATPSSPNVSDNEEAKTRRSQHNGDEGVAAPKDHFSAEARAVMDAGRELWRYYHAQPGANPDASYYDIRLHFQGTKQTKSGKTQMNPDSADARYTELVGALRQRLKALAKKIEPKVYEYGFLKK